jgi:DNA-binding response OmpR family regulator
MSLKSETARGLRVLVCDDDPDFLALATRALANVGCEVDVAVDAGTALAMQKQRSYPVQLLDMELPDFSGLELCRRIRVDDAISVLVAVTAHRRVFDIVDAREAGFDDLFYKPLAPAQLAALTTEALSRIRRWRETE